MSSPRRIMRSCFPGAARSDAGRDAGTVSEEPTSNRIHRNPNLVWWDGKHVADGGRLSDVCFEESAVSIFRGQIIALWRAVNVDSGGFPKRRTCRYGWVEEDELMRTDSIRIFPAIFFVTDRSCQHVPKAHLPLQSSPKAPNPSKKTDTIILHPRIAQNTQAQAPTRLIKIAPNSTNKQANTLFLPRITTQLWSLKKSSASSSISDANTSSPAEMAFIVPTSTSPNSDVGLYSWCVASPIAWPSGVVHPYANAISHGCSEPSGHEMAAMRAPRAMPSNVSATGGQFPQSRGSGVGRCRGTYGERQWQSGAR